MGTDISGITKNILQTKSAVKLNASAKKSEKEIAVSFMELMSQNSLSKGMNLSADSAKMDLSADTESVTKTAYDAGTTAAKSVSVKEQSTPEEILEESSELLENYEKELKKVLTEELGVTEEEITAVMENLGLSFLDLQDVKNLTILVQALTNEDVGTLFLSDAFQNVMEQVTALTEDLCKELGITREELNILCATWKTAENEEMLQTEAYDLDNLQTTEAKEESMEVTKVENQIFEVSDAAGNTAIESLQTATVQSEEEPSEQTVVQNEDSNTKQMENLSVISNQQEEELQEDSGKNANSNEENLPEHSEVKSDTANTGVNTASQQTVIKETFVMPQENTQPYTSQVDVNDIIQQIVKTVRVTISSAATSMEMQLNPEHLGKIYLNISEREGVVRAQIAAQNENVKEALETQLVELRQSLNQQGIKVDAIEVTVAAHEFEENLEGNARQDEQMQQQMEESEKHARRNLNLSELDDLSGLMTEEEQLAAQIMRENGNQVDLTA